MVTIHPARITIAPRLTPRLLDEIERQSRKRLPIAEINRRVGAAAWRMKLPRPSYERVRVLVHVARRLRRLGPKSYPTIAAEVTFDRYRLPELHQRLGEGPRRRLRDRASPSS